MNNALRNEELSHMSHPDPELPLSQRSTSIWKRFLQTLAQNHKTTEPNNLVMTRRLSFIKTLPKSIQWREKLRRDLMLSMSARSVHASATEKIQPLTVDVQADDWGDALSSRLTAAWDGEEAWQRWWSDHLGANAAEKIKALKRKRRQEKQSKRISGLSLLSMSSFTSSVSYQSDLSDWPWSDTGGAGSQQEDTPTQEMLTQDAPEEQRPLTPLLAETERTVTPHESVTAPVSDMSSEPAQSQASQSLDPSLASSSSSFPRSLPTTRSVASSQDSFRRSQSLSQSLSQSQSSQRLSQSSKPRRKSRMGF